MQQKVIHKRQADRFHYHQKAKKKTRAETFHQHRHRESKTTKIRSVPPPPTFRKKCSSEVSICQSMWRKQIHNVPISVHCLTPTSVDSKDQIQQYCHYHDRDHTLNHLKYNQLVPSEWCRRLSSSHIVSCCRCCSVLLIVALSSSYSEHSAFSLYSLKKRIGALGKTRKRII